MVFLFWVIDFWMTTFKRKNFGRAYIFERSFEEVNLLVTFEILVHIIKRNFLLFKSPIVRS